MTVFCLCSVTLLTQFKEGFKIVKQGKNYQFAKNFKWELSITHQKAYQEVDDPQHSYFHFNSQINLGLQFFFLFCKFCEIASTGVIDVKVG